LIAFLSETSADQKEVRFDGNMRRLSKSTLKKGAFWNIPFCSAKNENLFI